MTSKEFKSEVKKGTHINDILNYAAFGTFAIAGGFILRISLLENDTSLLELFFGICLLSSGVYGFWRIGKDYTIIKIMSICSMEKKWDVLLKYLNAKKFITHYKTENLIRGYYQKNFWLSLEIVICITEQELMINVRGYKDSSDGQPPFNFGLSRKEFKKLEEYLRKNL